MPSWHTYQLPQSLISALISAEAVYRLAVVVFWQINAHPHAHSNFSSPRGMPFLAYLHLGTSHSAAAISLLSNGQLWPVSKWSNRGRLEEVYLDTLALGQTDPWLLLANDEDVALPSGELVVDGVLDVDNVEASIMSLTVSDDTNTTHVAATGDHSDHTGIEGDEVGNLARSDIDLDGVIDLDCWVWVSDTTCPSVYVILFPTKH
jgi:hypothetical protein